MRRSKDYAGSFAAVRPLIEAEETALVLIRTALCALLCYEGPVQECHRLAVAEDPGPPR